MAVDLNYLVCDLLAGVKASERPRLHEALRKFGPEEFVRLFSFRTEEPLKSYRQYVWEELIAKYRKNFPDI